MELNQLDMHKGSPLIFSALSSRITIIPLLPKDTFTLLILPNPPNPHNTPYLPSTYFCHQHLSSHTVLIYSLHMHKTISILYDPLHSQTAFSVPALLCTSLLLTLTIHDTPTKHLKHFISRTFISFS